MPASSTAPPTVSAPASTLEPEFLDLVLHHEELSLAAKTIVVCLLIRPQGQAITRPELERLGRDAARHHLDTLLHELVDTHWLMTVPAGQPPCCAERFQLRQDEDPDDDSQATHDGHQGTGAVAGGWD